MSKIMILYHYIRTLYGLKFKTRTELLKWQDVQVQNFLRRVLPRSRFYREHFKNFSLEDWRDFPITTKSLMMNNFDQLNTVGILNKEALASAFKAERERNFSSVIRDITVGLSSGTSGSRSIFLVSKNERCHWAGAILAKVLPRSIFSKHKIAFFLRANSNLYETVGSKRIRFEFFDLWMGMDGHIGKLNNFLPSILVAPPSVLKLLAQAKEKGQLNIDPEKVISVAEVLDPLNEAYISTQFDQKIHQVYQATEGFLAATCACGTLHLNEDILVIQKEYLDKAERKFVPVITDFSRVSQPIIRYRLNDILTEKIDACPCGSIMTAIEKIEGRCDDIFYLPSNDGINRVTIFPDFISRALIYTDDSIIEYKIIQRSLEQIDVFFKLRDEDVSRYPIVREAIHASLINLFMRLNAVSPRITFKEQMQTDPHKKLKRVESQVVL